MCSACEVRLADFEFNNEYNLSDKEDDVDASAHSRNGELKTDQAIEPDQLRAKQCDLLLPCLLLICYEVEIAIVRQPCENTFRRRG